MTRRELREEVFKMLFRVEFHPEDELPEQLALFFEEDKESKKDMKYVEEKFQAIMEHLPEIDELINQHVEGWKTTRMAKVDLTLIRLAVYEFKFEELPKGIAINEAVEIAKKYGDTNSPSFINGALAKIS